MISHQFGASLPQFGVFRIVLCAANCRRFDELVDYAGINQLVEYDSAIAES